MLWRVIGNKSPAGVQNYHHIPIGSIVRKRSGTYPDDYLFEMIEGGFTQFIYPNDVELLEQVEAIAMPILKDKVAAVHKALSDAENYADANNLSFLFTVDGVSHDYIGNQGWN